MSDDSTSPADRLWDSARAAGAPQAEPTETSAEPQHGIGGDGAAVGATAETDIWIGRTHWKHYCGRLLLLMGANVAFAALTGWVASRADWLTAGGAFWVIAAVLLVSGLVVVGRVAAVILGTRYRLTSQRLFIERGILSQTVDQTELIRVDDVRLTRTLLDRVFGLGSVAIRSTDASDRETVIAGIAEPDKVAESVRTRMRSMRKKSLFVENL